MRVETKAVNSAIIFIELESKIVLFKKRKMFVKKLSFTKKRSSAAKQGNRNLARVPTMEPSIQHRDAIAVPNVEILGRSYLNHHAPNMEKELEQKVISEVELPTNNHAFLSEVELLPNNQKRCCR